MIRTLADLPPDTDATLDRLELDSDGAIRLMELGFYPGATVRAVGSAPGGDPRVFRVDGTDVALRRETARLLLVRSPA